MSGDGHLIRFSAEATLRRFNRRTRDYDIPADFVKRDTFEEVYIEHDKDHRGQIAIRPYIGNSGGGGGTVGLISRPYTAVSASFSGTNAQSAPEQKVSGVVGASFHPNGSSHPFHYEAKLERLWTITEKSATEISLLLTESD